MTIGYLSAGKCWPTASEAIDAYYSNSPPVSIVNPANSTMNTMHFINVSGVWKVAITQIPSATSIYNTLPTNVYGSCTLDAPPQTYPTTLTCTNCGGGTGTPSGMWDGGYDYSVATAAWTFAFITIMGSWLVAKHAGEVLAFIRRG